MSQIFKLPIKLNIVQSQSGAKGDFLAGWLGTLPTFLENHWTIDCETGQSFTHAKFFKDYQKNQNLDKFLADRNFFLSNNPTFQVAGTTRIIQFPTLTTQQLEHIKIIAIRVSEDDLLEVQWNRFVKNCLTQHRYEWAVWNNTTVGVDHFFDDRTQITNDDRCKWINDHLHEFTSRQPQLICPIATYVFDYKNIFIPTGSELVAKTLNLACSAQHHNLWQKNLEFSKAPNIIKKFGQEYSFEEFKHKYQSQIAGHL